LLLALTANSAQASLTSVSFFLDQNNAGLPDLNYATVTISEVGTDVPGEFDFNFEVLIDPLKFPNPGSNFGMDKFFFNYVDGLSIDQSNIVNINPSSWNIKEDKNAGGGFGKFEFELIGTGNSRVIELSFSIVGVQGDTLESYATGNPNTTPEAIGFFAAHVGGFGDENTDPTSANIAGSTVVPIPVSVVLLGSGLIGLVFFRRRPKG
jgi:hypothetical protein